MQRYYITDRRAVGGLESLLKLIRRQMHEGVDYLQVREKDLEARPLFDFVRAVVHARAEQKSAPVKTRILVNSRVDIALAAGADGVHLPAAAPVETLPGLLVGRSCHSLAEVAAAEADLVTFGPIYDTPGKGRGQGLSALREACRLGKPVFALGGVTWQNAAECLAAGAQGIAGIRLFQEEKNDLADG